MSEKNRAKVKDKEASITTTGINIKCLRVDGRNLTMSVFRQIPKKWFINEDGFGNIWGWVNYFWKNEQGKYHVIWEMDNKLYRYPISRRNLRALFGFYERNKKISSMESDMGMLRPEKAQERREEIDDLKKKNKNLDDWIGDVLEIVNSYEQLYIAT